MAILIVDDIPEQRQKMREILQLGSFEQILEADSALHLFEMLGLGENPRDGYEDQSIKLILMSADLGSREEGINTCRVLKESRHLRDMPVMMVMPPGQPEQLPHVFSAGAVDYVMRPVNEMELLARVSTVLRLKEEIDSRRARELELLEVTRKLADANRILTRLTFLDGLTGIANRRYFDEFLKKECRRSARLKKNIALIMIDIDYFKPFNDTYGHQDGDDCLKQVAQVLDETVKRPGDHVARYGGEEFSVILAEDVDQEGALTVAQNLRANIAALGIPHEGSQVADHVTISVGIAMGRPRRGSVPEKIIVAADRALYEAKRGGRDRVHFSTTMPFGT
ncbi:MAG: diguanylate cyclase [Magnetococcales bacterium]|nr:diguanylate cyclase [Magnetococcales bacterium]